MGTCTRTTITAATRRAPRTRCRCGARRRRTTRSTSSRLRTTEIRTPARACRRSSPGKRSPSATATRFRVSMTYGAFHTITACKDPCNGTTGIAYPIANGPVTFDSGELGYNGNGGSFGSAPASGTDSWKTPDESAGRHLHVLLPDPSVHEGCLPRGAADRPGPDPDCEEGPAARHGRGQRDPRQAGHGGPSGEGEGRERGLANRARRGSSPRHSTPSSPRCRSIPRSRPRSSSGSRRPRARGSGRRSPRVGRGRSSSPPRPPTGSARPRPPRPDSG